MGQIPLSLKLNHYKLNQVLKTKQLKRNLILSLVKLIDLKELINQLVKLLFVATTKEVILNRVRHYQLSQSKLNHYKKPLRINLMKTLKLFLIRNRNIQLQLLNQLLNVKNSLILILTISLSKSTFKKKFWLEKLIIRIQAKPQYF